MNYEVENMRVGDRTDFNRVRMCIETDGTITPKEALEEAISIMIAQLKAIVGFKEEEPVADLESEGAKTEKGATEKKPIDTEFLKTRIETLDFLHVLPMRSR